jgi:membrane protease YdiL (CAAX protease family)
MAGKAGTGWWRAFSSLSPVRFLLMGVGLFAAYVACQIALSIAVHKVPAASADVVGMIGAGLSVLVMLLLYAGAVRLFERRPATELALGPGVGLALIGVLFGLTLFCTVYALLLAAGAASWGGFVGFAGVGPVLAMTLLTAVGEEVVFRGVVFRVVEDSAGTLVAVIFSAALFGLLHALNHGATVVSTLAIALEAGVLLAVAYAWSRNLWFPIGLHFGWNFTEGGVFGLSVSGGGHFHGVVSASLSPKASTLMTGGAFGAEASVVAIAVCLAGALIVALAMARAGRGRKLSFRMRLA